jgi:hypothetical protein
MFFIRCIATVDVYRAMFIGDLRTGEDDAANMCQ